MSKTIEAIRCFLNPNSIAVIGASGDFSRMTGRTLKNLLRHKYAGKIYPINPKYEEMAGLRCYPSISEVPEAVDTAFIQIASARVIEAIKECINRGVHTAIVHTAGLGEIGEEGKERENEIKRLAEESGMRICGPNTAGIVNVIKKVVLTPLTAMERDTLTPGKIGLVSQSGGMLGALISRAEGRKIGFSAAISTGNEADLEAEDYIEYFLEDPQTEVVAIFAEMFRNIPKFLRVADLALERKKPLVILKIGRTEAGAKAAASHTGALTGTDAVYDAIFKQKGVTRVYFQEDLLEVASLFAKTGPPKGRRVGILTTTGGGAIHLADECANLGMELPNPSVKTVQEGSRSLPTFASFSNPWDITMAGAGGYRLGLDLFIRDENFDFIVAVVGGSSQFVPEIGVNPILEVYKSSTKPLVAFFTPEAPEALCLMEENGIPTFRSPEGCARGLKYLIDRGAFLEKVERRKEIRPRLLSINGKNIRVLLPAKSGSLNEHEGKAILREYGIPMVKEMVAREVEEALSMAEEIGYPVALKVLSPQILHKTEAGAVALNLRSARDVSAAYAGILEKAKRFNSQAEIQGVLIQEMLSGGIEVIVGSKQDPQFGPIILFGLGGVLVELFRDVAVRLAPVSEDLAREMIEELKGCRLLKGFRGMPIADIDAVVDVIVRVSQLAVDLKDRVLELDINPLIVLEKGKGARAVDALVVLS